jgi:hypothetical protein
MERLSAEKDPIFKAIGLRYPREILICMSQKGPVAQWLLAHAEITKAGTWLELLGHVEQAALADHPLPPEGNVVLRIFSESAAKVA